MTICLFCFLTAWALAGLPSFYWAVRGIAGTFLGLGPGFGPAALLLAGAVCLGYTLGWLWLPLPDPGPDGLLEPPDTTKALLPVGWRGELCSSIVSNQS